MKISVIGSGYVGLVTGAGLADFGNEVTCADIDARKIEQLRSGRLPIYEPGLDAVISRNVEEGRLGFTTNLEAAIRSARAIFIAVGTPSMEDGSADLRHVQEVARTIAVHITAPALIITKSTVPVGTGRLLEGIFAHAGKGHLTSVISNPEFLREGSAIEDFLHPDRVVIGTSSPEAAALMREIYAPLHSLEIPFVVTTLESAELIKYASNGFLATKITFINEVASLCERVGGDVQSVALGMGLDHRIGPKFLQSGPGYGGSCFPKDTAALAEIARRVGGEFRIIDTVIQVNESVKERMIEKVATALGEQVEGKTVGILGLAFKPETDDMRDSPTIPLIEGIQRLGGRIRSYDPQAMENARLIFSDLTFCRDAYEVAAGSDVLVIATEWNEFRSLNFSRLRELLNSPVVVDLRNLYEPERMAREGFKYIGLGRGSTAGMHQSQVSEDESAA